jgi:hypothetical protein
VTRTRSLRELADQYGLADPGGAWIASEPDEGDYHRRQGFRDGGRLLLATAAESQANHELIWPALAVYRHFYELQLKDLVRIGRQLLGQPVEQKIGHKLPGLLDEATEAMEVVWPDDLAEQAQPIRDAVAFLAEFDPTAQVTRYSTLAGGKPSVGEAALLDPVALLDFLEEGAELLLGAAMGMSVWVEHNDLRDGRGRASVASPGICARARRDGPRASTNGGSCRRY